MRRHRNLTTFVLAATLATAPTLAQDNATAAPTDDGAPHAISRVYRASYLGQDRIVDAAMVLHQVCLDRPGKHVCRYEMNGSNWITYQTDEATHELLAQELQRRDVAPQSLNFRVTLLVADGTARAEPTLAPGEQRALVDLRQVLSYKGYRLLDSGAVRAQREGEFRLGSDPAFRVRLRYDWSDFPVRQDLLLNAFQLQQVVHGGEDSEDYKLLLSTSFALTKGETVVVGTSKLNGNDEALIVLLTAEE